MPDDTSGLADDSKKKKICSKSHFGMLKMGERSSLKAVECIWLIGLGFGFVSLFIRFIVLKG